MSITTMERHCSLRSYWQSDRVWSSRGRRVLTLWRVFLLLYKPWYQGWSQELCMCNIHPNPFQAESPGLAVVRTVSGQKGKSAPAPPALFGSELSAAASNQQSLTWGLKTKHFMLHFYSLSCFLSGTMASKRCSWLPTSTSPILLGIGPQWTAYYCTWCYSRT